MEFDFELSNIDLDLEGCELVLVVVKYFIVIKIFQQSSVSSQFLKDLWFVSRIINLDFESFVMFFDFMKYMKKVEICKSICNLERFKAVYKFEFLQDWLDVKRK